VTAVTATGGGVAVGQIIYQPAPPSGRPIHLLPRPLYLAGRENLLADLHRRLADPAGGPQPRVVALCGLGGVGKTSTTLTYAHDHLDDFDLVWQLPAEDEAMLRAAFTQLGRQMGVHDPTDRGADVVAQVHTALAARPGRWLLILDNAPDASTVRSALPPSGTGCVIVTSRYQHWPHLQRLDVPVLNPVHATEFLLERTVTTALVPAARLAQQLGCLPLALEQAAAYIKATGRSIDEYLGLFATQRQKLLDRGEPLGYDARVATTWTVSFRYLAQNAPSAVALLRLLACCAPEPVPLSLLLERPSGPPDSLAGPVREDIAPLFDALGVDEAVTALGRFSLTSLPQQNTVSVHRLVQAVTLDQLSPHEQTAWHEVAGLLVHDALPDEPEAPRTWPTFSLLLPHALAVLPDISSKGPIIARYLLAKGDHISARQMWERITQQRGQVRGARHSETLQATNNLAVVLHSLGDVARSRTHLEQVLGNEVAEPEGQDPSTHAAVMNNLAVVLQTEGEFDRASQMHEGALQLRLQTLGESHPDTLVSMSNLALMLHMHGEVLEARKRFEQILDIRQRVMGDNHPATLLAMSYLAMTLRACGKLVAAQRVHERVLDIRRHVLGPEHPNTLRSMSNIGVVLRAYGNLTSALEIHDRALSIRRRILGEEHHDTLRSVCNRAVVLADQGHLDAAAAQFERAMGINERLLGSEHVDTLNAMGYLAVVRADQGDVDATRRLQEKVLEVRQRSCGEAHPDTLRSMNNVAGALRAQSEFEQAERFYGTVLAVGRRMLGPQHPEVLRTMNNIAILRFLTGDMTDAEGEFSQLVGIYRRIRGSRHPDTLRSMNNLGMVLARQDCAESARSLFERAAQGYRTVLSPHHPEVLQLRSNSRGTGQRIHGVASVAGLVEVRDFETERPTLRLAMQILTGGRSISTL
jgi:tetratricopeptide (TPR) repeat protein